MAYDKKTWATGDTVTAADLNRMEQGIDGVANNISVTDWTPNVPGAESYTYRHGTYAVIGNLAIIAFSVSGTFSSSASGNIVISGCPTLPTIKAAGGGYLNGYYAAEDLVFSGWSLSTETGYIAPVLHWATTAGTRYIGTAQQAPGAGFEASGTIAFQIE